MKNFANLKYYLLIIVLGALLFIPYLGAFHLFDWDELNFAEAAREMVVTGDYFTVRIDFQPFHEKPPLFFWMQALSMNIFGINEFAARFPNAIIGIITLLVIFNIGKKVFDYKLGMIWILAYIGSILPFFYFKFGIIDPTFNLFMFLSVYYLYKYFISNTDDKNRIWKIIIAGIFTCLAIMTKGPVGYLLPFLILLCYWFINRRSISFPIKEIGLFTLISAIIPLLWYIGIILFSQENILEQFISYQFRLLTTEDASHGGPFYYHFAVLLIGCFPSSVIMFRGFSFQANDTTQQRYFKAWLVIILFVVLVVFSIVNTKIIHYSSLAYFPITFLSAYSVYSLVYRNLKWKKSQAIIISIIGVIIGLMFFAIPILFMNLDFLINSVNDEFTKAILKTPVEWSAIELIPGIILISGIVISLIFWTKHKILNGFVTLFASVTITLYVMLPLIASRIETYLQGTAIEFYKSVENKDAYLHILNISSYKYGHFFYSQKKPHLSGYYNKRTPKNNLEEWYLTGKIDKPVYFITKNTSYKDYLIYPDIRVIGEKYGFVFMKRENE